MTDKTIGDLTAAGALDGTELVHVVQGGNSRRATVAEVTGQASVVLADIDLSARDLRVGQSPVVITGVENYERLDFVWDAAASSDAAAVVHVSNDGGTTFKTTSGDYGLSFWNATLQQNDANATFFFALGTNTAVTSSVGRMHAAGRSNVQTLGVSEVIGTVNSLTYAGRVKTREINNAIRVSTAQTTTAGRLVVIGYR
jgi:hypothetical protein